MAITFEVNWVCSMLVDLDCLFHKTDMSALGITIKKISSMDNWSWENRTTIFDIASLQKNLNAGKIIDIELRSETTINMGIFIEMYNNMYEYCFWLNVDIGNGFNEFGVTQRSKEYLQKIYAVFTAYQAQQDVDVLVLGMGFETTFCYDGDVMRTINKSSNIIVWIVNNSLASQVLLSDYKNNRVCLDFVAFEKWIDVIEAP